jgi:Lrp/AsnC family transcriptional regulator, leucine-responsive regulatory protein
VTVPRPSAQLDPSDHALLDVLQRDGRAPLTELAAQVHLGVSATRARLQKLTSSGVLTGFSATVDPLALGFTLHAVVRMKAHGSLYDKVSDMLDREPQIVRCLRVAGESCYVAEVLARDMRDLERITSELARIGSTTTDLVYEVVASRAVPTSVVPHTPAAR